KPVEGLNDDERQKASMLIALTLAFIPLSIIAILTPGFQDMATGEGFTAPNIGGTIGLIITIIAYIVSRTKYYKVAAYIMVAIPMMAIVLATLASDVLSESSLFYLSLSVILSSLLLSSRATLTSGILVIGLSIFLHLVKSDNSQELPIIVITFTLVNVGILSLTALIREQNLEALNQARQELRERIVEAEEARVRAE